ncbi:hypothetical protein B0H63DRAFT_558496 [Podospora didyma]|uniref:Protein kinase domain-containing protein n=1 Tax=Podospora didyma TaxID=330526 RepID=A0AAE0NSH3_9PEZI|nr:hypothetical protein B0H63DRAFT_565962 [Podospora didyma]KAK3386891.1 hypothetical protein B0H63DRAFT_558496 [Podospora didyma]
MAEAKEADPAPTTPRYLGMGFLDTESCQSSMSIIYQYNGVRFEVVAASPEDGDKCPLPEGYDFENSIEGKVLNRLLDLSWGEFDMERADESDGLESEFANVAVGACLPLMQELAPRQIPEPRTVYEQVYPDVHRLQILTGPDNKLVCQKFAFAGRYEPPSPNPPVPKTELLEIGLDLDNSKTQGIPVVDASRLVIINRVQGLVWKVTVEGEGPEIKICKMSWEGFPNAIRYELDAFLKIKKAGLTLNLDASEVITELKKKWAAQITYTLEKLHEIGILWRDVKTDNVLINDDGDAVVLDFGGGNTVGWVDPEIYGTMEGEVQGLAKIRKAIGV